MEPFIEVSSLVRRVRLRTLPPDETGFQMLLVPLGATDAQVLGWASRLLSPEALAELRDVIEHEAQS